MKSFCFFSVLLLTLCGDAFAVSTFHGVKHPKKTMQAKTTVTVAKDGKVAEVEKTHQGLQEGNDINSDGKGYVAIHAEGTFASLGTAAEDEKTGSFLTFNSSESATSGNKLSVASPVTASRTTACSWLCGKTDMQEDDEWCGDNDKATCDTGDYYVTLGSGKKSQCIWGRRCKKRRCGTGCENPDQLVDRCRTGCHAGGGKGVLEVDSNGDATTNRINGLECTASQVSSGLPTCPQCSASGLTCTGDKTLATDKECAHGDYGGCTVARCCE